MSSITQYLFDRRLGIASSVEVTLCRSLCTRLRPVGTANVGTGGAIYGLQFSLDGYARACSPSWCRSCLYAACESGCLEVHDPLRTCTTTSTTTVSAHSDSVNHVKCFDEHVLATASDDETVKVWDRRSWQRPLATITTHTSWAKNIGFDGRYMITSAFDDRIVLTDMTDRVSPPRALIGQ